MDDDQTTTGASSAPTTAGIPVAFSQLLPGRIQINEGESIELQVALTGTPPFTVIWVRNDQELIDCPEFRHLELGGGRYGLRLSDAFSYDSGVYFCEAYNRYGDDESWCRLIVTDPYTIKPVSPVK
jgi:hypothetical protein